MSSSASSNRASHARAILGPELFDRLPDTKVLLVGAGGIGCELLKNIVLIGFGHITLVDLDTIDLSNLNRQFLFRKKDVKQSKALVAAKTAGAFNPSVHIHAIHGNVKEPRFDVDWFQQFDLVLNALDNLDARRHVNKMCMAARIPLVESGTAGYLGQVQPLLKDLTECFDCVAKAVPKTFPVCTIRSTPSQPIHCIVWAKSYLCGQLFGEDEDAVGELDEAEKQGENAQEIENLRKEALAFRAVRSALRSKEARDGDAARKVFDKVFTTDILILLTMSDMWRTRAPPTPLDFEKIRNDAFAPLAREAQANGTPRTRSSKQRRPQLNGEIKPSSPAVDSGAGLKDQRKLTLKDNLELFLSSTNRLAARLRAGEETISFDKDDDDTLDFVTASSNLRSFSYGIEGKTRWEVKEMAGNIIPAIATTNAIISGVIVLQALHLLRKAYTSLRNVHIQLKPTVPLSAIALSAPNKGCGVCRDTYVTVRCHTERTTLGEIVNGVLGVGESEDAIREVSVYEDKRVLSDPDWEDNYGRTLESLNVTQGKFLSIVDEEGEFETIAVSIGALPPNHPMDAPPFILPSPLPQPPRKTKPPPPALPSSPPIKSVPSLKRRAPDDDDGDVIEVESAPKRPRNKGSLEEGSVSSPSKRRKFDEDGLLLMSGKDDKLEDEVIEID